MEKSPIHLHFETSDCGGYTYDLQLDFARFLEEARKHSRETNLQSPTAHSVEAGERRMREEKKTKLSWKHSFFKWWKAEKKSKDNMESVVDSHRKKAKKVQVSGPIHGSGRGVHASQLRASSGSFTNFLCSPNDFGNEIPYICLQELNNHRSLNAYGPVYLVT